MKKILIAGATGLIGQALIKAYSSAYQFSVLTRDVSKAQSIFPNITCLNWNDSELAEAVDQSDVVINLCGENIANYRWSTKAKKRIIDSRVKTTETLLQQIKDCPEDNRPRLLNASAIGIYGIQETLAKQNEVIYSEDSPLPHPATDFVSEVGLKWEAPLNQCTDVNIVKLRFGVVLSREDGMIKRLLLPFKLGLGGRVGSGEQPLTWIAIDDLVRLIQFIIEKPAITGPINLVAPETVSQYQFAKTLAQSLKRPCFMPMPSFMVKILFGQMGTELLLNGQKVKSNRLEDFEFHYATLEKALTRLLRPC